MANDYIDRISVGGSPVPVYAQSIVSSDGSQPPISFDTLNTIGKHISVAIPKNGWSVSGGLYTQTVQVTGITQDMTKTAYAVPGGNAIDSSGNIVWNTWVAQKKTYDRFAVSGYIKTGNGTITLTTNKDMTATNLTDFYIEIMEVIA